MKFFIYHYIIIGFIGFFIININYGCKQTKTKYFSKKNDNDNNYPSEKNASKSNNENYEKRDFIICPDKEGNKKKIVLPISVNLIQEYKTMINKKYLQNIFITTGTSSNDGGHNILLNEYVERQAYLVEYFEWCKTDGYLPETTISGLVASNLYNLSEGLIIIAEKEFYFDKQIDCLVGEFDLICRYNE